LEIPAPVMDSGDMLRTSWENTMKKCIVIPDSFKGSLTSIEICEICSEVIRRFYPGCEVITVPVADGGEGTVESFAGALPGCEKVDIDTTGPWGEPIRATYGRFGDTAIIEMASAAGYTLAGDRKDPGRTTTYGVGTMIRHAVEAGARNIILGLGGSATNDGGCGCAAALGVRFRDAEGNLFIPVGETLDRIATIDMTECRDLLRGVSVTAMCDIDNPMYGEEGAAYVFAPQKGADPVRVKELDRQLRCLDDAIRKNLGKQVADLPGAGAAGGFGAGCAAFLDGELKPGIETVLDTVGFDAMLDGTDMVFTGEGRIDGQSLRGKVVIGIARRAKRKGIPVTAVVGDVRDDAYTAYGEGVTAIFSINRLAIPFSEARTRSRQDLFHTFEDIMRYTKALVN
jgi:glycerate kinase